MEATKATRPASAVEVLAVTSQDALRAVVEAHGHAMTALVAESQRRCSLLEASMASTNMALEAAQKPKEAKRLILEAWKSGVGGNQTVDAFVQFVRDVVEGR